MPIRIEPAQEQDVPIILALVNRYADQNIMLPRTEESVRGTLPDWLVACEAATAGSNGDGPRTVIGCGSLVPLTDELVEVRSLAIAEDQQGKGTGPADRARAGGDGAGAGLRARCVH